VSKYSSPAAVRLEEIRESSGTSFTYGPTIGEIIDNHGQIIRSAGTPNDIKVNLAYCDCRRKYPQYVDHTVDHVRTMDLSILPGQIARMAGKGLNYRPKFSANRHEIRDNLLRWCTSVLKLLRHKVIIQNMARILQDFLSLLTIHDLSGMNYNAVRASARICSDLVVCSTDKVAQTATVECVHWYRHAALNRLLDPEAFAQCQYPDMLDTSVVDDNIPWKSGLCYRPAILFGLAKQHKRALNPLAYRWITNACADQSKPLSDEALRILTFLWKETCNLCSKLGTANKCKFFWSIDSLDVVPLNTDCIEHRPNRQISAFDLEKCFESIPLRHTQHSLMTRLELFLDLVWQSNQRVTSAAHPYLPGPRQECFWHCGQWEHSYSKSDILTLCEVILDMAVSTVGNSAARQTKGIPMGFSVSVVLLNIYMFTYEFEFVQRMK
jgi:hypothetical protein